MMDRELSRATDVGERTGRQPMTRTRMILAALTLAASVAVNQPSEAGPVSTEPGATQAECFERTGNYLLHQLPGKEDTTLPCLAPVAGGAPAGKVGRAAPAAAPGRTCPASECAVYIYEKRGIGYHQSWTYPVVTSPDFYGHHCSEAVNQRPKGHPYTQAFGLFDSFGVGAMTRTPIMLLRWCSSGGKVLGGATVTCSGIPVYPYFSSVACGASITPWNRSSRTVSALFAFTGANARGAGLTATIVAGQPRDVLVMDWGWNP